MPTNRNQKNKNVPVIQRLSIFKIDHKTPAELSLEKARQLELQKKSTHVWQTMPDGKTKKYVKK